MAKIYHLKSAGVAERLSGEQSNVLLKIGNSPTLLRLEINQNPNDAFITLHKVLKGNSTEPTHLKAFPPEKAGELEFTIGRNRETATHIQSGNATVSEFHATIRVDSKGNVLIADHSTNGTMVTSGSFVREIPRSGNTPGILVSSTSTNQRATLEFSASGTPHRAIFWRQDESRIVYVENLGRLTSEEARERPLVFATYSEEGGQLPGRLLLAGGQPDIPLKVTSQFHCISFASHEQSVHSPGMKLLTISPHWTPTAKCQADPTS